MGFGFLQVDNNALVHFVDIYCKVLRVPKMLEHGQHKEHCVKFHTWQICQCMRYELCNQHCGKNVRAFPRIRDTDLKSWPDCNHIFFTCRKLLFLFSRSAELIKKNKNLNMGTWAFINHKHYGILDLIMQLAKYWSQHFICL